MASPLAVPRRVGGRARRGLLAAAARRRRSSGLRRLGERPDELSGALHRAVIATLDGALAPEERLWLERIEERRARLEASPDELASPRSEWTGDPSEDGMIMGTVGDLCRKASKPPLWAGFLFRLLRELRPASCLELGTCFGISAAYQGAALEMNGLGRLVTLEAFQARLEIAREGFEALGLARVEGRHGRFQETLEPTLRELEPLDYAFVDGHHDEQATLDYWALIAPHLAPHATVVFDDIAWSEGMRRAWRAVVSDERIDLAVDLGPIGVCAVGTTGERELIRLPLL